MSTSYTSLSHSLLTGFTDLHARWSVTCDRFDTVGQFQLRTQSPIGGGADANGETPTALALTNGAERILIGRLLPIKLSRNYTCNLEQLHRFFGLFTWSVDKILKVWFEFSLVIQLNVERVEMPDHIWSQWPTHYSIMFYGKQPNSFGRKVVIFNFDTFYPCCIRNRYCSTQYTQFCRVHYDNCSFFGHRCWRGPIAPQMAELDIRAGSDLAACLDKNMTFKMRFS